MSGPPLESFTQIDASQGVSLATPSGFVIAPLGAESENDSISEQSRTGITLRIFEIVPLYALDAVWSGYNVNS